MKIDLWSIYYEPEPMGIAPVAATLAQHLQRRGHEVSVTTSHPHYPSAAWGRSFRPRREVHSGVPVLELPIYTRRDSARRRMLSEVSYGVAQMASALVPSRADVLVVAVPSVLAIPAAAAFARVHRVPWVIWLQDVVSAAAEATGLVDAGPALRMIGSVERFGFGDADRIVTISRAFASRLEAGGIYSKKVELIYLGASSHPVTTLASSSSQPARALVVGNIGLTQNLAALADAFAASDELKNIGAELHVTGDGVAAPALKAVATGASVSLLGVVSPDRLESELTAATIGIISQRPGVRDFNLPSKVTAYMSHGLPVFAIVNPDTEVAELVRSSSAGWVADSRDLPRACQLLASALRDDEGLQEASEAGLRFAAENFDPARAAARFESVLEHAVEDRARRKGQ